MSVSLANDAKGKLVVRVRTYGNVDTGAACRFRAAVPDRLDLRTRKNPLLE